MKRTSLYLDPDIDRARHALPLQVANLTVHE
jgi:hypothetical protein